MKFFKIKILWNDQLKQNLRTNLFIGPIFNVLKGFDLTVSKYLIQCSLFNRQFNPNLFLGKIYFNFSYKNLY